MSGYVTIKGSRRLPDLHVKDLVPNEKCSSPAFAIEFAKEYQAVCGCYLTLSGKFKETGILRDAASFTFDRISDNITMWEEIDIHHANGKTPKWFTDDDLDDLEFVNDGIATEKDGKITVRSTRYMVCQECHDGDIIDGCFGGGYERDENGVCVTCNGAGYVPYIKCENPRHRRPK